MAPIDWLGSQMHAALDMVTLMPFHANIFACHPIYDYDTRLPLFPLSIGEAFNSLSSIIYPCCEATTFQATNLSLRFTFSHNHRLTSVAHDVAECTRRADDFRCHAPEEKA